MIKREIKYYCHLLQKVLQKPYLFSVFATFTTVVLYAYSGESLALQESDKVAEIANLTADVTKLTKNGCYITGCASALIGAIWAVAQQSLKIAAGGAAVTLLAFKAPSFFTSTMLI